MARRFSPAEIDYARDRPHWSRLVQAAHEAAADPARSADRLADMAVSGLPNGVWNAPAAYPAGLCARVLATLAWAYGRQADADGRTALTPMLINAAGMVDELLAAQPAAVTSPPAAGRAPVRLPYAED